MKKTIAAVLSIAAIVIPQNAIAQTAYKDSLGNIIVSGTGLAPTTIVKIYYPQVLDEKTFTTSGACNLITVNKSGSFHYTGYIEILSTRLELSYYTIPPLPAGLPCTNGVPNPAYAWLTAGAYKYIQATDSKVFVISPTAGAMKIKSDVANFRLGKVDSCGRITINNSVKWPIEKLGAADGTFSYAAGGAYGPDLAIPATATAAMPICRKGTLYRRLEP
jgi:hypothetical protein